MMKLSFGSCINAQLRLDRYEAQVSDMTDEYVKRILVVVEQLVQSRLAGDQPRRGRCPD
jgi:hypothetical protein